MEELDKYLIDENTIRETVAHGVIHNSDNKTLEPKNERESKRSKGTLKDRNRSNSTNDEKSNSVTDFESLFVRHSPDVRYSHLIRISSVTKMKLQRILLSKQIQDEQRIALNCFIENILIKYLHEYDKEIKILEKSIYKI